jgi:peptidoglycan/LPS O-acetylase OafA/YrhL
MHYYPQINGLRALAVVPVLIFHCWADIGFHGGIGVDLFFVISGFLITRILLTEFDRTDAISIRDFYTRRFYRILPALVVLCLAVSLFIVALTLLAPELGGYYKFATVVAALTSTMNWARAFEFTEGGLLGHTWSLSVEEQFYLVWPLALGWALRRGTSRRTLLQAVVAAAVAVFLWRSWLVAQGASMPRIYYGTDTRIDTILVGCAIALSNLKSADTWLGRLWFVPLAGFAGAIVLGADAYPQLFQLHDAIVVLSCAWLVVLARDGAAPLRLLESRPATWIGKRSYSLYLWHYPPIVGLALLGCEGPVWGAAVFVASFGLADASYRFVERPFLARKAKSQAHGPAGVGLAA